MKTLIKSIIYCQTGHVFGPFTCTMYRYVVKNICQFSLPSCFVLTTGNILFRSVMNQNYLFSSESFALGGDNSLVHELTVMAAVELYINAIYILHWNQFMKKAFWVVSHFPLAQYLNWHMQGLRVIQKKWLE